ncbi:MAG: hypothetical protein F4Z60_06150 [Chloroflexi bacterium]|nr:hypothetical protein [Chloroflexota bacterium]
MRAVSFILRALLAFVGAVVGAVVGAIGGARTVWLTAGQGETPATASQASPLARRPNVSMPRPCLQFEHRGGEGVWIANTGPVTVVLPPGTLDETVEQAAEEIEARLVESAARTWSMFFMDQVSSRYH